MGGRTGILVPEGYKPGGTGREDAAVYGSEGYDEADVAGGADGCGDGYGVAEGVFPGVEAFVMTQKLQAEKVFFQLFFSWASRPYREVLFFFLLRRFSPPGLHAPTVRYCSFFFCIAFLLLGFTRLPGGIVLISFASQKEKEQKRKATVCTSGATPEEKSADGAKTRFAQTSAPFAALFSSSASRPYSEAGTYQPCKTEQRLKQNKG